MVYINVLFRPCQWWWGGLPKSRQRLEANRTRAGRLPIAQQKIPHTTHTHTWLLIAIPTTLGVSQREESHVEVNPLKVANLQPDGVLLGTVLLCLEGSWWHICLFSE